MMPFARRGAARRGARRSSRGPRQMMRPAEP